MKQEVNGVTVESNFDCPREEAEGYVRLYDVDEHRKLKSLQLTMVPDDRMDYIDIKAVYTVVPFDRIRRVTGYLTGTVDRWNNAKRAELKDRTLHAGAHQGDRSFVSSQPK